MYIVMGNHFQTVSIAQNKQNKIYGWNKDSYDKRDVIHNFSINKFHNIIKRVDMRDKCPPVYDQGSIRSCTANAIAGAYQYDVFKHFDDDAFIPSRLFIYYNEREMEGTINSDSGASIRDGIKSINQIGTCSEELWAYDISKFTEKPPLECYQMANNHYAIKYRRVQQTLEQLKQCLIGGLPFVFGFDIYECFESKEVNDTGIMPMPTEGEKVLGGHAVMAVGFDDDMGYVLIRNSWGVSFGIDGYFWMPYEFITNKDYCSDFWTIQRISDEQ